MHSPPLSIYGKLLYNYEYICWDITDVGSFGNYQVWYLITEQL